MPGQPRRPLLSGLKGVSGSAGVSWHTRPSPYIPEMRSKRGGPHMETFSASCLPIGCQSSLHLPGSRSY